MYKDYLGDGVYADFDGSQIWLSLQTGEAIAIEPEVFERLVRYRDRVYDQARREVAQRNADVVRTSDGDK